MKKLLASLAITALVALPISAQQESSASGGSAPQTTIQAAQHDSSVNGQNQTGINDDLDAVMDAGTPRDTTSSQLATTMDATTGQTQLEQQANQLSYALADGPNIRPKLCSGPIYDALQLKTGLERPVASVYGPWLGLLSAPTPHRGHDCDAKASSRHACLTTTFGLGVNACVDRAAPLTNCSARRR